MTKLVIQHRGTERIAFPMRPSGDQEQFGISTAFPYFNQSDQKQFTRTYLEQVFKETVRQLLNWAFKKLDAFADGEDAEWTAWLVSALFYCVQHFNDDMPPAGNQTLEILMSCNP